MAIEGESAVLSRLATNVENLTKTVDGMRGDLNRWQERHEKRHERELREQHEEDVKLEGRLTELKGAVSLRSWLAGLGMLASAVVSAAFQYLRAGPTPGS